MRSPAPEHTAAVLPLSPPARQHSRWSPCLIPPPACVHACSTTEDLEEIAGLGELSRLKSYIEVRLSLPAKLPRPSSPPPARVKNSPTMLSPRKKPTAPDSPPPTRAETSITAPQEHVLIAVHLLQSNPGPLGDTVLDLHLFDLISEVLTWWQTFLFILDPIFEWDFTWDGCATFMYRSMHFASTRRNCGAAFVDSPKAARRKRQKGAT